MQKSHSMRKDEIDCYIVFGWIGHLREVQRQTDHQEYVNVLQQQLLASAIDIYGNQKPNFIFLLHNDSHRQGHWFPGLITRISNRDCCLLPRYEYHRYGNGMHHAQIEERATLECFITLSLCPTGLAEIRKGHPEISTHVCLISWQNFAVHKPTRQNFDGMCTRVIVPGC